LKSLRDRRCPRSLRTMNEKISEKDCLFCKIVRGEIPSLKICEDHDFLAFMDIKPVNPGHALVVPKKHCSNILDFPRAEEADFVEFVKKVAKAVTKATKADGFNLGMNNGAAAGQVVFHAHLHVIPRYNTDGFHNWPHKDYKPGEMEAVHKKIVSFL
jgi:histidine triad (HIT) family protein